MELQIMHLQRMVSFHSQPQHLQPVLVGSPHLVLLERVAPRRQEPHLIYLRQPRHVIRKADVPEMHRVE